MRTAVFAVAGVCACTILVGCSRRAPRLTVGSMASTEQQILGEILAQHLEKQLVGQTVERRTDLGGSTNAHQALLAGEIDLYPEYLGSALTTVLHLQPVTQVELARSAVAENYRLRHRCEWFGPLGFENPPAFAISAAVASAEKIRTLSEAAALESGWALAVRQDFAEREDGLPFLLRQYPIKMKAALKIVPYQELYATLEQGQASMAAGYSTDAALGTGRFLALVDDRHAYPSYEAGIVVRASALEDFPSLASSLKALKGKIVVDRIRALNKQVDLDKVAPEVVAAGFLRAAGL